MNGISLPAVRMGAGACFSSPSPKDTVLNSNCDFSCIEIFVVGDDFGMFLDPARGKISLLADMEDVKGIGTMLDGRKAKPFCSLGCSLILYFVFPMGSRSHIRNSKP